MKNFTPDAEQIKERVAAKGCSIQEAKAALTTEHVVAEIRHIHDSVNAFNTTASVKRLCTVLDYAIRTGAIKF